MREGGKESRGIYEGEETGETKATVMERRQLYRERGRGGKEKRVRAWRGRKALR